jgi:superfamily II DNA or RNA helicase
MSTDNKGIGKLVKTVNHVIPMIYAYTTPDIPKHDGWTKIGYTEKDVDSRISEQTHTADIDYHLEWKGNAIFEDGSGETFRDTDFHQYLRKNSIENKSGTEWFKVTGPVSKTYFDTFRANRGVLQTTGITPYQLRDEQKVAVENTKAHYESGGNGQYLWNAKPRFGKTLAAYDFCKQVRANKVLIVTNRPAIANSWYDDYCKFFGTESGYYFISSVDALKGKKYVITRDQYVSMVTSENSPEDINFIEFVSLQDLKGSIDLGGKYSKLPEIASLEWDVLIIDEAHEGVDTYKTDVAFDHIKRKFTLHLSGTPFKALANDKFKSDEIFNWTYADEQEKKRSWNDPDNPNPYANLPQLTLFTYQMSEIVREEIQEGVDIDGETEEYAFDLNEFFATNNTGRFVHDEAVNQFLDALTSSEKYPFSTPELRAELKHTFWLLNRVDSARALAKKLQEHRVFKDYEVVLAAGDGKIDDDDLNQVAFNKVREAIKTHDKTITLSVGQLTTGVTIPEWTGVLMLSNLKSPALYMQAAFRAQNPCLFNNNGTFYRKENAYVFDFDPARTLTIFEEFANDLYEKTANGRGGTDERKQNIRTLLNFFPVIGEDEDGKMVPLDAEKILSIPRAIRSKEVVDRKFMSDYLFQNVSNVFHAPQEVISLIQSLPAAKEPKDATIDVDEDTADKLSLDGDGNVKLSDEFVINQANEKFGPKIYDVQQQLQDVVQGIEAVKGDQDDEDKLLDSLKDSFREKAIAPILQTATQQYSEDLMPAQKKRLERKISSDCEIELNRQVGNYKIQKNKLDQQREGELSTCRTEAEQETVNRIYDQKVDQAVNDLKKNLSTSVNTLVENAGTTIVSTIETDKRERAKNEIEDQIKDHLRGFSRTIPSFLMAYGDDETTLENFDTLMPENVFKEVTSITLKDFKFLRDGGDYLDEDTGETRHFDGHLFDQVVFDDSVKVFNEKKRALSDYFDEKQPKDIFDYIPPQKTNQIFTPKSVVIKMVDLLEKNNPGCFDNPDATFLDPYMKSGLFITEIVKRLFNSPKMKSLFPDDKTRLKHIFGKQVYGIAPTEIILRIATNYILGFDEEIREEASTHFILEDTAELAKDGEMAKFITTAFPNNENQ